MSLRGEIQERIVAALEASAEWTAPYGIVAGLRGYGRGKVRTVTFGVALSLDAELLIIQPDRLELLTTGQLAHACPERFASCDEFLVWAANPWTRDGLKEG